VSYVQKDGSKTVHEIHIDLIGIAHDLVYQASAIEDLNANLARHASDLGNSLGSGEVSTNIGSIMTLGANAIFTLVYSTVSENVAALRAAYASAIQAQAVLIGDFLNTLTDIQLQNAFNLTPSQVTTLRNTKLIPAANLATALRASTGA
jgi:hypothetical protein